MLKRLTVSFFMVGRPHRRPNPQFVKVRRGPTGIASLRNLTLKLFPMD